MVYGIPPGDSPVKEVNKERKWSADVVSTLGLILAHSFSILFFSVFFWSKFFTFRTFFIFILFVSVHVRGVYMFVYLFPTNCSAKHFLLISVRLNKHLIWFKHSIHFFFPFFVAVVSLAVCQILGRRWKDDIINQICLENAKKHFRT